MRPVIVAGHVCVDLTPALDAPPGMEPGRLIQVGPLAMSAGGCVGNTGAALAALGVPTHLVASAGSDELGRVLIALLAATSADTSGVSRLDGRGTSYTIVVDVPGRDRTFWHHLGANAAFDGTGVIVSHIDTGADATHPALILDNVLSTGGVALNSLPHTTQRVAFSVRRVPQVGHSLVEVVSGLIIRGLYHDEMFQNWVLLRFAAILNRAKMGRCERRGREELDRFCLFRIENCASNVVDVPSTES